MAKDNNIKDSKLEETVEWQNNHWRKKVNGYICNVGHSWRI